MDAWFGADKAGHFAACAAVTWAAWALQQRSAAKATGVQRCRPPRSRAHRLTLAVAAGLVVGSAKEALDGAGLWPTGGAPSFRDFVADAAGSLAAAAVVAARTAAPPPAERLSAAGTPLQEV